MLVQPPGVTRLYDEDNKIISKNLPNGILTVIPKISQHEFGTVMLYFRFNMLISILSTSLNF